MKWLFLGGWGGDGRKLPVTGRIQAGVGWLPIMNNINSSAKWVIGKDEFYCTAIQ